MFPGKEGVFFRRQLRRRNRCRCRSCRRTGLGHCHQADQFLAHARLLQPDQALHAGIEIRSRGVDQLEDELFVESGLGQGDDVFIREWLMSEGGGRKLLTYARKNREEDDEQNTHTLFISTSRDGVRGRISPMRRYDGGRDARFLRHSAAWRGEYRIPSGDSAKSAATFQNRSRAEARCQR
jgi:hypothetical protein